MSDYKKAFDTFQEGLKHDPTDKGLLGGVKSCLQKLHEGTSGDDSRKDKSAEGTILSQQEKGESSLFENVIRQECADHHFTKFFKACVFHDMSSNLLLPKYSRWLLIVIILMMALISMRTYTMKLWNCWIIGGFGHGMKG